MAMHKKLIFSMQIEESVPTVIYQDEQRIGQVLVNIMNNAVKYTFNGTVSVIVEIVCKHEVKVVIKDSGKGIEKMSLIGQWFGNTDIVENVNQNGIGFGITISKKLIEKLGGHIFF